MFSVSLSATSSQPVTVNYSTANGTATAGIDYTAASGILTFLAGSTTTTALLTVQVNGDLSVEPNETFFVNLSNAANAAIADVQGVGTIANGVGPAVTVNNTVGANFAVVGNWPSAAGQGFLNDVHYNDAGTGLETAKWTRSVTPGGWYRVSTTWTTDVNRATNAPYTILNDTITLGTVRVNQEQAPNDFNDAGVSWEDLGVFQINSGTLMVQLSDDANEFVIADAIRIEQVDPATPRISITDVSLPEGNVGTNFVFAVTLSAASTQTVTVNYSTANGTASAGSDYTATSGTLTFLAGSTTATMPISVPVNGDTSVEPDETFFVNLSNASNNAAIADVQGLGTIVNDDMPLMVLGGALSEGAARSALSSTALAPYIDEAIARWTAVGLSAEQITALESVAFQVTDLDALGYLGLAQPALGTIQIDDNAAGYGWYLDAALADNAEFKQVVSTTELSADPLAAAARGIDLLTVVLHELGHVLGLDDLYAAASPHELMTESLGRGTRHLPALPTPAGEAAIASAHGTTDFIVNDDEGIIVALRAAVNAPAPEDPQLDLPTTSVEAVDAVFAADPDSSPWNSPSFVAEPAESDYDDWLPWRLPTAETQRAAEDELDSLLTADPLETGF